MDMVLKTYRRNQPLFQHPGSSETLSGRREAMLCLPIEIKGRVWGVLYHENTYTTGSFHQFDRTVLPRIIKHLNLCFAQIEGYTASQHQRSGNTLFHSDPTPSGKISAEIWASSEKMGELLARADQIAVTTATVLILGETGVGKELLARRLHSMSHRRSQPFVVVELTSVPETLVESELFGHEKGAFTGADQQKQGRIELANEGTLFLDEIGDIPMSVQVKLLRVLQEGTFTRLGGRSELRSGFRLIAATNRNLSREVMSGRFREDLFYRLNVVPLMVPPLRERGDDIVLLAEHFLQLFSRKYQKKGLGLSKKVQNLIRDYHWPGNVRELRNVMERAVILSTGTDLELGPLELGHTDTIMGPLISQMPTMAELQRQYIGHVLQHTGGRIGGPGGAAEILGMKRTTLNSRMKQLGLKQNA
jgi:transcriptional regulator with GAF, ATPase, and Fis domain